MQQRISRTMVSASFRPAGFCGTLLLGKAVSFTVFSLLCPFSLGFEHFSSKGYGARTDCWAYHLCGAIISCFRLSEGSLFCLRPSQGPADRPQLSVFLTPRWGWVRRGGKGVFSAAAQESSYEAFLCGLGSTPSSKGPMHTIGARLPVSMCE